jgi:NAD(P)-dependent dehydrogenase (short-subunit alcohol dehydrogenase family)
MTGKICLVTGANSGIGKVTVRRLAEMGARVVMVCRNRERGQHALDEIRRKSGAASLELLCCDLSSQKAIRNLAIEFLERYDRLHVLVNNAGLMMRRRTLTEDGLESTFAVNHLAYFLLTNLLLDVIKISAPARIVNVASLGQQPIEFDDVMLERGYDGPRAYRQSKLAQIMFTLDLAAELEGSGVTVNCLHPATFMDTTMVRQSGTKPISTIAEGADAVLNLVTADAVSDMSGLFFNGLKEQRANEQAYDDAARAQLRALSLKLTGLA